jgi:hypothetical protein
MPQLEALAFYVTINFVYTFFISFYTILFLKYTLF